MPGFVLSGNDSYWVEGLKPIKQYGGAALLQHPKTAESTSMPINAMLRDGPGAYFRMEDSLSRVR